MQIRHLRCRWCGTIDHNLQRKICRFCMQHGKAGEDLEPEPCECGNRKLGKYSEPGVSPGDLFDVKAGASGNGPLQGGNQGH